MGFFCITSCPIAQNSANTTVAVTGTAKLNGILDNDIVFLSDGTVITGQYLDVSQPGQQLVKINIDRPVLDGADKGNYSVSSPVDKTIQGQVNAVSLITDKDSIVPVNPDNVPADTTYFVERSRFVSSFRGFAETATNQHTGKGSTAYGKGCTRKLCCRCTYRYSFDGSHNRKS